MCHNFSINPREKNAHVQTVLSLSKEATSTSAPSTVCCSFTILYLVQSFLNLPDKNPWVTD